VKPVATGPTTTAFIMLVSLVHTFDAPVAFVRTMAAPLLHFVGHVPVTPPPDVYGLHASVDVPVLVRNVQTLFIYPPSHPRLVLSHETTYYSEY
jgi:hypothetical protein